MSSNWFEQNSVLLIVQRNVAISSIDLHTVGSLTGHGLPFLLGRVAHRTINLFTNLFSVHVASSRSLAS